MTGSGSAVFGTFPDKEAVERAAPEFVRRGWVAVSCEPLPRSDYRKALGLA